MFSQDQTANFFLIVRNIINYATPGYQDITQEKQLTYHEPLSISDYVQNYFSIRPYDVFIKCYDKNTNEVYYTRNTFIWMDNGYVYLSNNFVLNKKNYPRVNKYRLISKNHNNYIQLQYKDMTIPEYIDDSTELEVIDEILLKFYKPIGNIIQNIDNIFFQFDSVDEISGYVERNTLDLSNIDLISEIRNLRSIVETIGQNEIREKYLNKIKYLEGYMNTNFRYLLYSPHIVIAIISQFYNMEILKYL
jgi:hypothetical protein